MDRNILRSMTTTPMKSVLVLSCSLLTMVACEKKKEEEPKTQTGKEAQPSTTAQPGAATQPGTPGHAGTGQPGQPGAEGTLEQKMEHAGERIEGTREEMAGDTKAALERAETRLNDLEARLTKATNEAKTSGRQMSQDLTTAKATAKAKAEAARQAAADKLDAAVEELDKALDDLDKRIKEFEGP